MGYIPKDAKWYLAEIVHQITVAGEAGSLIHTNMVLIRADSPEEAYVKATELGVESDVSYDNPDGKRVQVSYKGLHDLNVIHGNLEHGTELIFSEHTDMDEDAIRRWVSAREDLGVFADIRPPAGLDYRSKDVVEELREKFPNLP